MAAPAFTAQRRVRFLHFLAQSGNVRAACEEVGVSPQSAYVHKRRDAAFAKGWDAALLLARDAAEEVLADRALNGSREMVFYRGEVVGSRVRFDTRLLLAHLARLDRHHEAEGAPHGIAARFDDYLHELITAEPGFLPPDHDRDAPPQWHPRHPTREEAIQTARDGASYAFPADLADLPPEQLAAFDPEDLADPDLWSRTLVQSQHEAGTAAAAAWTEAAEARRTHLDTLFAQNEDHEPPHFCEAQMGRGTACAAGGGGVKADPLPEDEGDHARPDGGPAETAGAPPSSEAPPETKAARPAMDCVNRVNRPGGRRSFQRMKSAAVGGPSSEVTMKVSAWPAPSK
ncbi:MAG: hypothetical protein WCL10_15635 [Novosphingobium sp.]|uniref:hypothetical protein n=1 Tax=Novosphingobium sp. TaxID=1874826 RepID=UPI0030167560